MLPVAPPSLDYIPGPEEPQRPPAPQDEDEHKLVFIQPHDPDFMPEPIYPKYIPLEDEHILPAEEQPLPPDVLPTTKSLGYFAESDPEEYEDDETEDGLEEEHLAPADSAVVIPIDELASPLEGTKPIIPPPSTDTTTTGARITIRPQTSISLPPEAEVERLLSMLTLSPSPLTSLSPPSAGERLARCTTLTELPSPLLQPSLYPPPVDRRDDILESKQQPPKRICLSTLGSRYEVGESSTRGRGVDYGFVDTIEVEMRHQGIGEVGVTELAELHEHDTQDLYALLEDAQDVWIMKEEAYAAREAWAHSIGLSQIVHHELQTLREQVYAHEYQLQTHQTQLQLQSTLIQTQQQLHETHSQIQQTEMVGLRETNRVRQSQIVKTLRVMRDTRREMGDMQAELLALRGQPRRAAQPGGDARVLNHQDTPRDADS
nr:hypothetical protein [Tanacetum cinerariifolium]